MSHLQRACKTLGGLALVFSLPCAAFCQSTNSSAYSAQGAEYLPAGAIAGDQANSSVSINSTGGYIVWQDNVTDGDGLGISAVHLDKTLSPTLGNFRVNLTSAGDQENPQVALLASGGAAFVWQSGPQSEQHIVARFLALNGTWLSGEIAVNTATNVYQSSPAIATLANGNIIVTWASYGQDNADGLQGVYGQILSPTGQKVGSEFQINQFTPYNQRTPAVAAFTNGNFIVAWVSEEERFSAAVTGNQSGFFSNSAPSSSVDIYARVFTASGGPAAGSQGSEFLVNSDTSTCANPTVATASDGTYVIAWGEKDVVVANNSWDVYSRKFSSTGVGSVPALLNTQRYGDQYAPKLNSLGTDYLAVWTSLGQDGSLAGVFGQFLKGDGSHAGGEIQINTTVLNQQEFPAVSSDGAANFFVVWSSLAQTSGLNIAAQRFATSLQPLLALDPPLIISLDSQSLSASWPPLLGYDLADYELFVDGASTPSLLTNNFWSSRAFAPGSSHTFQLGYTLSDGRVAPLSVTVTNKTWGADNNFDGLPDDWETLYYGANQGNWPAFGAFTQIAPGVTALEVFLWGGNPKDPSTWLSQSITHTSEGLFLNWNTVPGGIYQVLTTTDFKTWTALGTPRFAAGTSDSIFLGQTTRSYFKIVRNRY